MFAALSKSKKTRNLDFRFKIFQTKKFSAKGSSALTRPEIPKNKYLLLPVNLVPWMMESKKKTADFYRRRTGHFLPPSRSESGGKETEAIPRREHVKVMEGGGVGGRGEGD